MNQDTPQPTSQPTPQPPTQDPATLFTAGTPDPEKPPRNPRLKLFIIGGSIALVLALIAAVIFFFQSTESEDHPTTTPTAKTDTPREVALTATSLIDEVRTAQKKIAVNSPELIFSTSAADTKYSPTYKYGTAPYYIRGTFGEDITAFDSSAANSSGDSDSPNGLTMRKVVQDAQATAAAVFKSHSSLKETPGESYTTYYSDAHVICTLSTTLSSVTTTCADIKDYAPLAKTIQPLAESYLATVEDARADNLVFSNPQITQKSHGFTSAKIGISSLENVGGFAGLFYTKDNGWVFWRGTQSQILCSDYNSYALQTAFEGETCYDPAADNEHASVMITLSES